MTTRFKFFIACLKVDKLIRAVASSLQRSEIANLTGIAYWVLGAHEQIWILKDETQKTGAKSQIILQT